MRRKSLLALSLLFTSLALADEPVRQDPQISSPRERARAARRGEQPAKRVTASAAVTVDRRASTAALGAVGELTYDNDVPFARGGADGGTVGNLFDTGVLDPHSIAAVEFRMAGNYGGTSSGLPFDSVILSIWDRNLGSFQLLDRRAVMGLPFVPYPPNGNTVTMFTASVALPTPLVHDGSFVVGLRNTDYDPCGGNVALNSTCDGVALTAGGVDPGRGFHAFRVPFNDDENFFPLIETVTGAGTSLGNRNAIMRVTGDNLPVELMRWSVD